MQRGRFAQEFLLEVLREPRVVRTALLADRTRWLRALKLPGKEELLFEFELLLRAIEQGFERRHPGLDGQARLGHDFAEELRCIRDALHRAGMVARRLTLPSVEQGLQFRAYLASMNAEETRRGRVDEASEGRTPDESLFALRAELRALQGLCDQLLRQPFVGFQAFADIAVVGEHLLRHNRYFRPPGALDFRAEYDRVGSVRLLELVKQVPDDRTRKSLALAFLACFRLLRAMRHVPAVPTAAPRRAIAIAAMVADECMPVAAYLATDLPRLCASAPEPDRFAKAGQAAAQHLRDAANASLALLAKRPFERAPLEEARSRLVEAAKAAAGELSGAVEPGTTAAELFDGARARKDRAQKLRRDLGVLSQLLRRVLDALFPVMKGELARPQSAIAALGAFAREFRSVGYYLLRSGDHEPFDRFFSSVNALAAAAPSPVRDRHLYLECRRFVTVVDRALALVARRAELVGEPLDQEYVDREVARFGGVDAAPPSIPESADTTIADQLLTPPVDDDETPLAADLDEAEPDVPPLPFVRPSAGPGAPPSIGGPLSEAPPAELSAEEKESAMADALRSNVWRGE